MRIFGDDVNQHQVQKSIQCQSTRHEDLRAYKGTNDLKKTADLENLLVWRSEIYRDMLFCHIKV